MPFSLVSRLLGTPTRGPAVDPTPAVPTDDAATARSADHIGWAVRAAARRTPWRSECYPQALTARAQLVAARIPHTVSFGVRRNPAGALTAHTWVSADGRCVVGGSGEGYTTVGQFTWAPRNPVRGR